MPYISATNNFKQLKLRQLNNYLASAINKSNQKIPISKYKNDTLAPATANALGKYLHCFLKMLSIFSTTTIYNYPFIITFKHPQK